MTSYSPFNEGSVEGDASADKLRAGFINLETQLAAIQNVNTAGTPLSSTPNLFWCTGNGSDAEASFRAIDLADLPATISGKTLSGNTLSGTSTLSSHTFSGDVTVTNNTNPVYALPTNYHDVDVEYTSVSTITVKGGSRVRSSDDTTDIINALDIIVDITASGANGLDTGSEANSTWYYLYAIYNPTTSTTAYLLSTTNEAASGSITLPSGYTKKRQIPAGVIYNSSPGDIVYFNRFGRDYYWNNDDLSVGSFQNTLNGASSTVVATVTAGGVPATSRLAYVLGFITRSGTPTGDLIGYIGEGGSGLVKRFCSFRSGATTFTSVDSNEGFVPLNGSQQLDYKVNSASSIFTLTTTGFRDTEVK